MKWLAGWPDILVYHAFKCWTCFRFFTVAILNLYPLVMTKSLPWYRWPIEIDGLPFLKMGGFSTAMLNNQMVFFNINLETVMFQHLSYSLRRQFDVNHSERHRRTFVCRFVAVDHHIITFGIIWECANFTRRCLMVNKHGWLKILPWKIPFNSLIMPLHSNSCPLNPSNIPLTTLKFFSLTPNLRSMPLCT